MGALQAKPIRLGAIRAVALSRDSGESLDERLGHRGDSVSTAKAVPAFGLACDRKSLRRRRSAVNYSGGAPVRQPVPELPEQAVPSTPVPQEKFESSEKPLAYLRLLWARRRMLSRALVYAAAASTVIAFLIPARYESTARLMPPDNQSSSSLAMAAPALSGAAGGLGGIASDFLGLKSTSDVFVGILTRRTVQDQLIQQFDLKKLYGTRSMENTRKALAEHTGISVDRKSQIISISVIDRNPQRAAAMGQAYVAELNHLVADLSTSSARRARTLLEGCFPTV